MSATTEPVQATTSYLPPGMPRPGRARDGLDAEFWDGTKRHELMIQRCNECRGWQFGPEWICYRCHSYDLGWEQVPPRGRLHSWERAWHHVVPALKGHGPYLVVLVDLDGAEGCRLVGNLLGDPMIDPVIGAEVEAVFEDHEDGETLVQWQIA